MKKHNVCRGMAFAALPLVMTGMVVGVAQTAFADETSAPAGTSKTNDEGVRSITKSTPKSTLPRVGETIRYTLDAKWDGVNSGGNLIEYSSLVDRFDPTQLRFIEARVLVTTSYLTSAQSGYASSMSYIQGYLDANDWLNERLKNNGGNWTTDEIDSARAEVSAKIADIIARRDAAIASGDKLNGTLIGSLTTGWRDLSSSIQSMSRPNSSAVKSFQQTVADKSAGMPAVKDNYNKYTQWIASANGADTVYIPTKATVTDGKVEFFSPTGDTFPFQRASIQYDMEYLGSPAGEGVSNEGCFGVGAVVQATSNPGGGTWTPPPIAPEGATGCVTITLHAPTTTVNVVKKVQETKDGAFDAASGWGFEIVARGLEDEGTTTDTGFGWTLPTSTEDRDVILREVSAPNALLADYKLVSVTCESAGVPIPASINSDGVSATVSALPAGSALSCEFRNAKAEKVVPTPTPTPTAPSRVDSGPAPTTSPSAAATPESSEDTLAYTGSSFPSLAVLGGVVSLIAGATFLGLRRRAKTEK